MNKTYRFYAKMVQEMNYLMADIFKSKSDCVVNILNCLPNKNNRLPKLLVKKLSRSLKINERFPAGKAIEFVTDSKILEISILYRFRRLLHHVPSSGTAGIDVYLKQEDKYVWIKCISPKNNYQMYLTDSIVLDEGEKTIKLFLPLFAALKELSLKKEDIISFERQTTPDIVVYGSSISHGYAASRPGLCYANQIALNEMCNVANYGFSESAKGELDLIKYISGLGEKVFILEYDHNATVEELEATHLSVYKSIRGVSNCWIVMMTRFSGGLSISLDEEKNRIEIIKKTYDFAVEKGDKKVEFIDGSKIFLENRKNYFVDGVHPNDHGMQEISQIICTMIDYRRMLEDGSGNNQTDGSLLYQKPDKDGKRNI